MTLPRESHPTAWAIRYKRAFDAIAAATLLLVLSPILLLVAACIRLSGPVFFRQDRAGWHGRIFRPWKFRTMRADRRPDPKEIVPLGHSDITRLGRFLRRTKLDELPQLINVLMGEMSLVGPRPTLPDQVAAYDEFRRQRLLVRPGMTGLAQVNSTALASWEERILYDVAYVRLSSFRLDMAILLRTVLVVIFGEQRMSRPFAATRYAQVVSPPAGYWREGPKPDRPTGVDAGAGLPS